MALNSPLPNNHRITLNGNFTERLSPKDDTKELEELMSQEQEYVDGLTVLMENFLKPLSTWAEELESKREALTYPENERNYVEKTLVAPPDLSLVDVTVISCNVEDIVNYHSTLLDILEKARQKMGLNGVIKELRTKIPLSMVLHSTYLYNVDCVRKKLNVLEAKSTISTFIRACEIKSTRTSSEDVRFHDLLLLPAKQVIHYYLVPALRNDNSLIALNRLYNLSQRVLEDIHKWNTPISPLTINHRFEKDVPESLLKDPCLKEGILMMLCNSGPVPYKFLLFRGALAFGYEMDSSKNKREQFLIREMVQMSRCYIVDDVYYCKQGDMPRSFMILSRTHSFILTARTQVQKAAWFAALSGVINSNKDYGEEPAHFPRERNPSTPRANWVGSVLKKANIKKGKNTNGFHSNVPMINEKHANGKANGCLIYEFDDLDSTENHICSVWMMDEDHNMIQKGFMLPGTSETNDAGDAEFEDVMENEKEREIFRKHLEASHCSENLLFWEMVTKFRNNGYIDKPGHMILEAKQIIDRFMREESPDQVNISSHMRNQVISNFESGKVSIDIFEDSLRDVMKMLERDSFLHFCSSPFFAELLEMRLLTSSGELKERCCGILKYHQLNTEKIEPVSPTVKSLGSAKYSMYSNSRHGNFSSPTAKSPSTVVSENDNSNLFSNYEDDNLPRDESRINSLAQIDAALGKVAFMDSWTSKQSDNWFKRFTSVFDSFPACISISDMTKIGAPLIFVSREFCKVTMYSRDELYGKNCRILQGPETEMDSIMHIRERLSKGLECNVKIMNYKKDGQRFQNLLSLKPVFDANGIYRYVIGILFEVVHDKTLKRRVNQLDTLLRLMPSKLQNSVTSKSRAMSRMDQILQAVGEEILEKAEPKGGLYEKEEEVLDMSALLDLALNEAAVNKVWSSRTCLSSNDWLQKFISTADTFPACIVVTEMTKPGNPLVFVNQWFSKYTGYRREETIGKNCRFLQGPETEPESVSQISDMLSKGQECHIKITNYRKDGSKFLNLLCLKPVFDVYGIYKYVVGVQFEITANIGLRKRLAQLEKLISLIPSKLQTYGESLNEKSEEKVDLLLIALGSNESRSGFGRLNGFMSSPVPRKSLGLSNLLGLKNKIPNLTMNYTDGTLQACAKAWSKKSSDSADEWLANFVSAAETFPACLVVAKMTVPGTPLVYVNEAFTQTTGYSKNDSIGRNCKFLQGPDTEQSSVDEICACLSKGLNCHVKITNYRKNGEKFQNLLSMKPVYDANGIYRFTVGIQFEVMDNKMLKKRLSQLEGLFKSIPNKLQIKNRGAAQRCLDLMRLAIGAPSISEAVAQGIIQSEDVDEGGKNQLGTDSMLENALNLLSISKGWAPKNSFDTEDWLRNFASTAENFPACIVVSLMTQPGAPIVFVNQAFTSVTGYTKEDSVGRNCRFLQGPDTEPEAIALIRSTLSQAQECHIRLTNYRKNGEKFLNLLSMKPVFDAEGVYTFVIGVQFEVTVDKGLKKRLAQLDKLLQLMPSKLQSKTHGSSNSETDLNLFALAIGSISNTSLNEDHKANGAMPEVSANLVRRSTASLDGAIITVQRRRLWSNLNKLEPEQWLKKFSATIENFPASMVITDITMPGAPMVYVNQEFCRLTGYSKGESIGRNCRFLQKDDSESKQIEHIRNMLRKGQDCNVKLTNYRKNGEKFNNLLSMKPVVDSEGNYRFIIGVQFEVVQDEGLAKRLKVLERLLRIIPTRLEPVEKAVIDEPTAKKWEQGDGKGHNVERSVGSLSAY